ncbi:MAG TPA: fructose-6-phosphate aldolase [bacterium]|nr:fructose-6-phosphate aldolase [bacterium]HOC25581.1 fructose-6-phosphate aldolase [bacterium]HOH07303.1 fructose-6-phosphate aldolase [bacterium]HOY44526.1 fructose-6-phosphate aldolase [bacterium]HPG82225.1 fructose-6-phosphate aldolase [bacterium]
MKFFIDTANLEEIKRAKALGVADGVTTNPTLIAREPGKPDEIYRAICALIDGPVCAEVVSLDTEGILREGRELAGIAKNIVIKIPVTKEGLMAVKVLESEGIRTLVTLIFSPLQALLAAKAGASFICPFVGRLDDTGQVGMELVEQILSIYANYEFQTEIIVASIRNPLHVLDAATMGAHIATIPLKVIEQLVKHPLTDAGIQLFLKDWESVKARS